MDNLEAEYYKQDTIAFAKLLRKHSFVLLLIITSYLATFGLNVYLARLLKPKEYGDISVIFQLLVFFAPFALLGTEISLLRFIPKYLRKKEYGKISGFLRWNAKIFLYMSLGILLCGVAINIISYYLDKHNIHSLDQYHLIFFSYWLIPLYALLVLTANFLQSIRSYYLSATFNGFLVSFFIIAAILLFLPYFENTWIGSYQRKYSIVLCIGISYLIICIAELFTLLKKLPKEVFQADPSYEKRKWFRSSTHMMLSTVIFAGLSAVDIVMLDILAKNEAIVGQFAAIFTISSSLMVFSTAVDMIVNPIISPSIAHEDTKHLQITLHLMNVFKSIPIFFLFILLLIFGKDLLEHFGKGFAEGYPSLIIMVLGFVWGICFNSSGPLLLYSHHERLNFFISFGQLLFIILMDIPMIRLLGLMGAVIVLSLSIVLSSILRTYFCHRFLGIKVFFYY
ncbi:MAG: hypothetical protein Tsb0015_11100 [Simkaniaceae bacterium]